MDPETLAMNLGQLDSKMKMTKQKFLVVKHNLNNLLLKKDDIYIEIGPKPKIVEMLANVDYYLKVDILPGTISPVILKIHGRCEGLHLYGSCCHKKPSVTENEFNLKDPDHLKIKAPSRGIFEKAETYYFTLNSVPDTQHL